MFPYLVAPARVACATNADGDLHVVFTEAGEPSGSFFHTIRYANGQWQDFAGDIIEITGAHGPTINSVAYPACAMDSGFQLHVCAIDRDGKLWHTIRGANGDWQGFGDVQEETRLQGPDIGGVQGLACATNGHGDLHICVLDAAGKLYHTIRLADGTWPYPFGYVEGIVPMVDPSLGGIISVACACSLSAIEVQIREKLEQGEEVQFPAGRLDDDLQIGIIDTSGRIWHTIRLGDGTWPFPFGYVQDQTAKRGPALPALTTVAVASDKDPNLHVLTRSRFDMGFNDTLWHTIRAADGTWDAFGEVVKEVKLPTVVDEMACSTNLGGDLHVIASCLDGSLRHTIRLKNRTWPYPFGIVSQKPLPPAPATPSTQPQPVTPSQPMVTVPAHGIKTLSILNCNTDHHEVHVWVGDVTTQSGWVEKGALPAQYDDFGICPADGSMPIILNFQSGHQYSVVVVDPERSTCDLGNDPESLGCLVWGPYTFVGDSAGTDLRQTV